MSLGLIHYLRVPGQFIPEVFGGPELPSFPTLRSGMSMHKVLKDFPHDMKSTCKAWHLCRIPYFCKILNLGGDQPFNQPQNHEKNLTVHISCLLCSNSILFIRTGNFREANQPEFFSRLLGLRLYLCAARARICIICEGPQIG